MTQRRATTPAPGLLEAFAQGLDPVFGRWNQREGLRRYLEGLLLLAEWNKTLTGLTHTAPGKGAQEARAQSLQWFLSEFSGDEAALNAQRHELIRQTPGLAPHFEGVLIIDETGDLKDGTHTAYVGRQSLGNVGKIGQGVVSVSSVWADEQVYYPLNVLPYTPSDWFPRGKKDPAFRTKLGLVIDLVKQAAAQQWPFKAVVATPPHPNASRDNPDGRAIRASVCPTLTSIAAAPKTRWQQIIVSQWHGQGRRSLEIVSDTAMWYHAGQPPLPIRWVLIRDPKGGQDPSLALDRSQPPAQANHPMVRPALALGGHVPGTARTLGDGDSTPMVRQGHPTHHASPLGLLLAGDPDRSSIRQTPQAPHAPNRLVSQTPTNRHRCTGPGARPNLEAGSFPDRCFGFRGAKTIGRLTRWPLFSPVLLNLTALAGLCPANVSTLM